MPCLHRRIRSGATHARCRNSAMPRPTERRIPRTAARHSFPCRAQPPEPAADAPNRYGDAQCRGDRRTDPPSGFPHPRAGRPRMLPQCRSGSRQGPHTPHGAAHTHATAGELQLHRSRRGVRPHVVQAVYAPVLRWRVENPIAKPSSTDGARCSGNPRCRRGWNCPPEPVYSKSWECCSIPACCSLRKSAPPK